MPNSLARAVLTITLLATLGAVGFVFVSPILFDCNTVEEARQRESLEAPRDIGREIIRRAEETGSFPSAFQSSGDIARAYGNTQFNGKPISGLLRTLNPNGGVFVANQALAGAPVSSIKDVDSVVLLYETEVWPNGNRLIVTVDGDAQMIDERDFTLNVERVSPP